MNLGNPIRKFVVEPAQLPIPAQEPIYIPPIQEPFAVPAAPEREPAKVAP